MANNRPTPLNGNLPQQTQQTNPLNNQQQNTNYQQPNQQQFNPQNQPHQGQNPFNLNQSQQAPMNQQLVPNQFQPQQDFYNSIMQQPGQGQPQFNGGNGSTNPQPLPPLTPPVQPTPPTPQMAPNQNFQQPNQQSYQGTMVYQTPNQVQGNANQLSQQDALDALDLLGTKNTSNSNLLPYGENLVTMRLAEWTDKDGNLSKQFYLNDDGIPTTRLEFVTKEGKSITEYNVVYTGKGDFKFNTLFNVFFTKEEAQKIKDVLRAYQQQNPNIQNLAMYFFEFIINQMIQKQLVLEIVIIENFYERVKKNKNGQLEMDNITGRPIFENVVGRKIDWFNEQDGIKIYNPNSAQQQISQQNQNLQNISNQQPNQLSNQLPNQPQQNQLPPLGQQQNQFNQSQQPINQNQPEGNLNDQLTNILRF